MNILVFPSNVGYVNASNFTFYTDVTFGITSYLWSFGDNTFSAESTPDKTYTFANSAFSVNVSALSSNGSIITAQKILNVTNYVNDSLQFTASTPIFQGISAGPFELTVNSSTTGSHILQLYVDNSNSQPYLTGGRWTHLLPTWQILDVSGNNIDSITVDDTIVYYNNIPVGTNGTARFYIKDDLPSSGINIWATLSSTDNIINNNMYTQLSGVQVNPVYPQKLMITRNGHINNGDINGIKWLGKQIPYVVTINGEKNINGITYNPILFNYPLNETPITVNTNFKNIPLSSQSQSGTYYWANSAELYLKPLSDDGFNIGGIIRAQGISDISANNTQITANCDLLYAKYSDNTDWIISTPIASALPSIISQNNSLSFYRISASSEYSNLYCNNTLFTPNSAYNINVIFKSASSYSAYNSSAYLNIKISDTVGTAISTLSTISIASSGISDNNWHTAGITIYNFPSAVTDASLMLTYSENMTGTSRLGVIVSSIQINLSGLYGESNYFDIIPYNTYDIRRFNESWEASKQIREYALVETIKENDNLFDNYLGPLYGNPVSGVDQFGPRLYEKISNFSKNNADIDKCNIDQLYSLSKLVDVPIDDYKLQYPAELKRIMDIISVHHDTLWGKRCECSSNFTGDIICTVCNHKHSLNLGDEFEPSTYTVSADIPFIVKKKYPSNSNYQIITPSYIYGDINTLSSPVSTYSLASVSQISWLLSSDFSQYKFFNYNNVCCGIQSEGVINWDDEYGTLSENISSYYKWYGENQIIDNILTYYLYKGLNIGSES